MALSEIQKQRYGATSEILYNEVRGMCNDIEQFMAKAQSRAEFINKISAADLTAMTITDANIISRLTQLKGILNELVSYYNNQAVTPATNPQTVIDDLRNMNVI
jgi:hypothetical protein